MSTKKNAEANFEFASFSVNDLNGSKDFYCKNLGFFLIKEDKKKPEICILQSQWVDNCFITLEKSPYHKISSDIIPPFAFEITFKNIAEYQEIFEKLNSAKLNILYQGNKLPKLSIPRSILFLDSNGNLWSYSYKA